MGDRSRDILENRSILERKTGDSYVPDLASQMIVYHLLDKAGLGQEDAAYIALIHPEPEIFHPVRSKQAHELADWFMNRSQATNPVEALLYISAAARPVLHSSRDYFDDLKRASAQILKRKSYVSLTAQGAD
jgi:membrane peptidoglycan carboxypeptidase